MKLVTNINPKRLFRSKKSRSVSRSDPLSFSSGSSSSSESSTSGSLHHRKSEPEKETPTSVLPSKSLEISCDWSEICFEFVQTFKMIDKDGDGKITSKELEALLSRVGLVGAEPPTEEELKLMLSDVDKNGDGCISLEEFGAISSAFESPACDSELREAFDFFDSDHDGRISAEELHAVFAAIGDEQCTLEDCRRMISGVDKNRDGFVCFGEFARMMEQQR